MATDDNAEYGAENIEAEGEVETTNDVEGDEVDVDVDVDVDDDVGVDVIDDVGVDVIDDVGEFVDGLLSPKNESIGGSIYTLS